VAAVLAVVAAVAAGAVARLDGAGRPTDRPDAATATSPTATAASPTAAGGGAGAGGFSPRVCDQAPAGNLPRTPLAGAATVAPNGYAMFEGWSFHRDPAGFGVAVPDGWTYAVVGTTVCFRDPDGVRVLSVDPARTASADPVVACRKEADRLTTAGALPGYRELRIDPVPYFGKAADWEYRYTPAGGTGLHATTRWFAAGSRAYAVGWVTRAFDWQVNRANLGMIMGSFQPLQT
jgi:catechol 2,3-dioxygenase-like lactoylglutathione lyase family enzyme